MFRLARHCAGVTADARRLVDHEPVLQGSPSLPGAGNPPLEPGITLQRYRPRGPDFTYRSKCLPGANFPYLRVQRACALAEADGNRTRRGPFDPPPVLKTGEPTRRSLASIPQGYPKDAGTVNGNMTAHGQRPDREVLRITGLVAKPRQWSMEGLAKLGGQVTGTEGRGVAAGTLLEASGPRGCYVTVESEDGEYRASIPIGELSTKGVVVYGLGESQLPRDRGGPFRMLVPGGRTLCWNVKGVGEMRVTAEPEPDSVPTEPLH